MEFVALVAVEYLVDARLHPLAKNIQLARAG
jgi:hypothetical protein